MEDPLKESGFMKDKYVKIEGPGILLMETGPQDDGIIARTLNKRDATR